MLCASSVCAARSARSVHSVCSGSRCVQAVRRVRTDRRIRCDQFAWCAQRVRNVCRVFAALSVFGAIGSLRAGAFDQLGVFLLLPCSVCAVWVGVHVGVAVGSGAPVDVAVGGHVDVTAFFASRVDIGTCVNVFLCFGRLELLRYGLRRRVRA